MFFSITFTMPEHSFMDDIPSSKFQLSLVSSAGMCSHLLSADSHLLAEMFLLIAFDALDTTWIHRSPSTLSCFLHVLAEAGKSVVLMIAELL